MPCDKPDHASAPHNTQSLPKPPLSKDYTYEIDIMPCETRCDYCGWKTTSYASKLREHIRSTCLKNRFSEEELRRIIIKKGCTSKRTEPETGPCVRIPMDKSKQTTSPQPPSIMSLQVRSASTSFTPSPKRRAPVESPEPSEEIKKLIAEFQERYLQQAEKDRLMREEQLQSSALGREKAEAKFFSLLGTAKAVAERLDMVAIYNDFCARLESEIGVEDKNTPTDEPDIKRVKTEN
ncbi:hypothetical protein BJ508DRAFT_365200 [Ascobolus immersus RN42]|uniref:Uncharacterized protein n=1 Tax=Ascobolus immersus RN42 TaxID=1160509 RepID=A0A3N4HVZ9_ASCIM|nr:hypothetical protein BJ508DRAFT_365200 [Ascobolus immersus RN42]